MQFDQAAIELFKQTIQRDGFIYLPSAGNSMFPFIHSGDICRFVLCSPKELKTGDVALYYSTSGDLIAHRFVARKTMDTMNYYLFKGDTNLGLDVPVEEHQVLGKLATIQKAKQSINVGDFSAGLWGKLILGVPVLSGVLQKYLIWKRQYQF